MIRPYRHEINELHTEPALFHRYIRISVEQLEDLIYQTEERILLNKTKSRLRVKVSFSFLFLSVTRRRSLTSCFVNIHQYFHVVGTITIARLVFEN
jgi:uncharacterized protein YdcH (DUF465 family)